MERINPAQVKWRAISMAGAIFNLLKSGPVTKNSQSTNRYSPGAGGLVTGGGRGTPKKRTSRPKKQFHRIKKHKRKK